jgi:hypothetical protein
MEEDLSFRDSLTPLKRAGGHEWYPSIVFIFKFLYFLKGSLPIKEPKTVFSVLTAHLFGSCGFRLKNR